MAKDANKGMANMADGLFSQPSSAPAVQAPAPVSSPVAEIKQPHKKSAAPRRSAVLNREYLLEDSSAGERSVFYSCPELKAALKECSYREDKSMSLIMREAIIMRLEGKYLNIAPEE